MNVGIDLDNTIIRYDGLLRRLALAQGRVPASMPENKQAIRDHVRQRHGETAWRELQARLYGEAVAEAELHDGVWDFLAELRRRGLPFQIVSHKTRRPAAGDQTVDLRQKAMEFLEAKGFFRADGLGMDRRDVHFCDTRADKTAAIARLGHTVFIDDLEEVFLDPGFPPGVLKILFSPAPTTRAADARLLPTFAAIARAVLGEAAV